MSALQDSIDALAKQFDEAMAQSTDKERGNVRRSLDYLMRMADKATAVATRPCMVQRSASAVCGFCNHCLHGQHGIQQFCRMDEAQADSYCKVVNRRLFGGHKIGWWRHHFLKHLERYFSVLPPEFRKRVQASFLAFQMKREIRVETIT